MKKKIVVFTKYFYPVIAGKEINMLETYKRFAERGWDITVNTTNITPDGKKITNKHETKELINIHRYSNNIYNFFPFRYKNLNDNHIVCLHDLEDFPHLWIYFYTYILKLLNRKKYILIFSSHGLFNIDLKAYPGLKMRLKRLIDHTLGVYLINRTVDGIRVISEIEMKGLINAGIKANLITRVGNGLPNEAFIRIDSQSFKKRFGKYILQVGRVDKIKNFEATIKAMPYIGKDVKFVIAGPFYDDNYRQELVDLIERLNLIDRVIFLGPIYGTDKFRLMKQALLYIQLSWSESFGNTVYEAMSQGTVCIVSKNTGMSELIRDNLNGFNVNPNNVRGVANKIKFVLDKKNSLVVSKMKKKNIDVTKESKWDNVSSKVENYYLSVNFI